MLDQRSPICKTPIAVFAGIRLCPSVLADVAHQLIVNMKAFVANPEIILFNKAIHVLGLYNLLAFVGSIVVVPPHVRGQGTLPGVSIFAYITDI